LQFDEFINLWNCRPLLENGYSGTTFEHPDGWHYPPNAPKTMKGSGRCQRDTTTTEAPLPQPPGDDRWPA